MLKGKSLGHAIRTALAGKGLDTPSAAAKHWGIKPPSASGWFSTGRISMETLLEIMDLCADQYGPAHWGLSHWPGQRTKPAAAEPPNHYQVTPLQTARDAEIEEMIRLLQSTDTAGRAMALAAVKGMLETYKPAHKHLRASSN